jgi:hypothetical protein
MVKKKTQKIDNKRNNPSNDSSSNRRCMVRVEEIKFSHDPSCHTIDALNIRKNYGERVIVPGGEENKPAGLRNLQLLIAS